MDVRFSEEERQAVKRLVTYAGRKNFIADLLVNGYNGKPVSMRFVMRYAAGEPQGSTYKSDVMTFLDLMSRGVEIQELIGDDDMAFVIKLGS
jgi:hypothetical protein